LDSTEGDACDLNGTNCTAGVDCDDDCDGVPNQNDNCQYVWNPSQGDNDHDGIGNACDVNTDKDRDGKGDPWAYENSCTAMNMYMVMPMEGMMEMCDNCPDMYNPNQKDSDRDGMGDCCDPEPGCTAGVDCDAICDYCECDFNCSGGVDAADVDSFLGDFGRSKFNNPCTNGSPCQGDTNCDGNVAADDVTVFLEDFGRNQFNRPCPACVGGAWCVYPPLP